MLISRLRYIRALSPKARAIRKADKARDIGDPTTAAARYRSIIDRWGIQYGILVQMGNALKDSGSFDAADEAYERAQAMRPDDADVFLQRGHLMKLWGDIDKAIQFYTAAAQLDPARSDARRELDALAIQPSKQHRLLTEDAFADAAVALITDAIAARAGVVHRRILERYRVRR